MLKTVVVVHWDLVLVALKLEILEVRAALSLGWVCSTPLVKAAVEVKSIVLEVNLEEDVVKLEPQ